MSKISIPPTLGISYNVDVGEIREACCCRCKSSGERRRDSMQLSVAKGCPSGTEYKEGTSLTKAGGMRLQKLGINGVYLGSTMWSYRK
jgi:hypothetical protein